MTDLSRERLAARMEESRLLACPNCRTGSSFLSDESNRLPPWAQLSCSSCGVSFDRAEAIDEMFVQGTPGGYAEWCDGRYAVRHVSCRPGETAVVNVRGLFQRVYRIIAFIESPVSYLAGGLATKYLPQGLAMAAVAGVTGEVDRSPLNIYLHLVGQPAGAPPLSTWREILWDARLAVFETPMMVPVLAVSALDLFIEDFTGIPVGTRRPSSWSRSLAQRGLNLGGLLGNSGFERLAILIAARNKVAHGRDPLDVLPADVAAEEARWRPVSDHYEGEQAYSPMCKFSLRVALHVIRVCRRERSQSRA